ncbi:MAG: hypothetical protein KA205_08145, partial [Acidobacteria bacterium]|nr:hypothetical protein [Acidobacteriota bacterium]
VWTALFVMLVLRTRGVGSERFPAAMLKSALFAVGVISLVSMPTQSLPVALTVWVIVYWYVLLAAPASERLVARSGQTSVMVWPTWVFALGFVAATVAVGWTALRPPYRAIRADWTYQVGFYDLEQPAGGTAFRWTEQRAVIVVPVTGAWLKLTVGGGPSDVAARPLMLKVKRRGQPLFDVVRTSNAPQTWYVQAPSTEKRMMLEFELDRFWRPAPLGSGGDDRELGVTVDDWVFVDAPPPGAVVIR